MKRALQRLLAILCLCSGVQLWGACLDPLAGQLVGWLYISFPILVPQDAWYSQDVLA